MSKSNYAEVEVLKYLLTTGTMGARPTAWFVGLHTTDPADAGGGEVSGAGYSNYARQPTTFAAPTLVDVGPSTTANTTAVAFPALSGSGVTAAVFANNDALSGGNMLNSNALGLAKQLVAADIVAFAIGDLLCSED